MWVSRTNGKVRSDKAGSDKSPGDLRLGVPQGLILAGAIAMELDAGLIPIRRKGKLPGATLSETYELEYGTDHIEVHSEAISKGERVLLVEDLITTGSTAEAAIKLIERARGGLATCAFIVDLPTLGSTDRITRLGHSFFSLCHLEDE